MAFFYIDQECIQGGEVHMGGSLGHHLRSSLRCRVGEKLIVVDPARRKYHLVLTQMDQKGVRGAIEKTEDPPIEVGVEVLLGQGIPKGKKLEVVLQKSTELGVGAIFPFFSDRTVVQPRKERMEHDMQRWRSILEEASQQSQRLASPTLHAPCSLDTFLRNPPEFDLGLFLWEKEKDERVRSVLRKYPSCKKVLILVGPEGGFTEREAERVVQQGFVSVSLGERVLRTETVGPFMAGLIQYEWGDIGSHR